VFKWGDVCLDRMVWLRLDFVWHETVSSISAPALHLRLRFKTSASFHHLRPLLAAIRHMTYVRYFKELALSFNICT
jgi:hypothetical protein